VRTARVERLAGKRQDERMPHPPSFQTVKLARGRHAAPQQGVCTVELASMLAGERFTDQPRSACPAVAAFVRGYNDAIDDARRQDLYAIAAMLVDSYAGDEETHLRMWRLIAFARDLRPRRLGVLGPRLSYEDDLVKCESAGRHAAKVARRHHAAHLRVLGLIEELLGDDETLPSPVAPREDPRPVAPA
jgi:hypothetical protein